MGKKIKELELVVDALESELTVEIVVEQVQQALLEPLRIYAKDYGNAKVAAQGLIVGAYYRVHDLVYMDEVVFEATEMRMFVDFEPSPFVNIVRVQKPVEVEA